MGIGERLCRDLAKLVMRAAGDQAKTSCGNLQLCEGLEAGIWCATHVVGKRVLQRERNRRIAEEARRPDKDEDEDEAAGEKRLIVET